ncbi:MAG: ion transporter [Oscillospiraceae bacterium]|nr:ion transporter [Oscillospiraceae bacterium]
MKLRTYEILEVARPNDTASRVVDIALMTLILINVSLIIADTFELPVLAVKIGNTIEIVSVVIFSVEYLLRIWSADLKYPNLPPVLARLRFMVTFTAIIDLVSLLPSYISVISANFMVLRMLRVLRLLRAFKLNRYTHALRDIADVFKKKASQLISSMLVVAFLMLISAVLMYDAEHEAQPEVFENAFSGLWWAIVTVTTVGYGDVHPITVIGRVMGSIIAILGIALIAVPTGIITAGFSEQITRQNAEREAAEKSNAKEAEDEKKFCPYCGHKLD